MLSTGHPISQNIKISNKQYKIHASQPLIQMKVIENKCIYFMDEAKLSKTC